MLGVDDVGLKRDRLDLALADCKEDGFRILISHNPDIINKMSGKEQISLVLSGHTHGGQIRLFPSKKYLKGGVYKHSNMTLLLVMGMEQRWFHFASEHLLKHILLRYAEEMMPTLNGKYNIKAVSNIIGIQPSTLRAWERRYQMIAPKRNHAGHRLYTEEHIQILKWLMDKVSAGMMIGQAVQLLEGNRLQNNVQNEIHYDREVVLVDDILQALLKFDEITTSALLNEAFSIYTTEKL